MEIEASILIGWLLRRLGQDHKKRWSTLRMRYAMDAFVFRIPIASDLIC